MIRKKKTLVLLGVLFLLLLSCDEQKTAPSSGRARPVVVHIVKDTAERETRSFSGAAKASVETPLSFRVAGKVLDIHVRVGDSVNEGASIARLDPADYRIQVKEAQAALARTQALLGKAQADYDRARLLYETENISRAELDGARAAFLSARAEVSAARERLGLADRQLEYTFLKSPIEGMVAKVPVEIHQMVGQGAPVAMLTSGKAAEFEFGVPDRLIRRVKKGAPAEVSFKSLNDESFPAQVTEVGILSPGLSLFPVTAVFKQTDAPIFPGMIGEVSLNFSLEANKTLPVVPLAAVWKDPLNGSFVWIVNRDDMRVFPRAVHTGRFDRQGVVVTHGLQPGDAVVIRGVHRIREGQKVSLMEEITP